MASPTDQTRSPAIIIATALIATFVTQILYMALLGGPQPADPNVGMTNADIARYFTDRWSEVAIVWTVEAAAFLAIALGALVALAKGHRSWGWAALAIAGTFNLIQITIGLSLFKPVALSGEAYTWMFWAIVAGAFAFYFLAKVGIGIAAAVFGLVLWREARGMSGRWLGGITLFSGVVALLANLGALGTGMGMLLPAGASGTFAAIMLACCLLTLHKRAAP